MVVMAPVKKPKRDANVNKKELLELDNEEPNEQNIDGEEEEISEEIRIIAQEVKIVKSLACNDLVKRNKQMKKLRKWLQLRAQSSFPFKQEDFLRIWKGLYYNMWYSDKPLVQEELAEQLAKLLECFEGNLEQSVNFFGAFLETMCIQWFGIDQWRIDKFLMLTRRMLRYMFKILKANEWSPEAVEVFNTHATESVLSEDITAKGLTMHYLDIFFEELAKVSEGKISSEQVALFVKPFVTFTTSQKDFQLISHCRSRVFYHLLYQSDLGREYSEKYNAWKDMGFPTKNINDLEKCEESENDDDSGEQEDHNGDECSDGNVTTDLDPRAGNVDVFMPVLPLDAQPIVKDLEDFLYKTECPTKRRKMLRKLLDVFKTYQNGEFPLGIKTMPRFEDKSEKPLIKDKIRQLENLENELYGVDRKLKQLTKRKRRKLLKSLNYDDIDESNYEQTIQKALPKDYLMERRKKSQKAFMAAWLEEELDESDLRQNMAQELENGTGKENNAAKDDKVKKPKKQKIERQSSKEEKDEPQKKLKKLDTSLKETPIGESKTNKKLKKSNEFEAEATAKNTKQSEDLKAIDKHTTILESQKSKEPKIPDPKDQLTPKSKPKEPKILKISDPDEQMTPKNSKKSPKSLTSTPLNEWDEPLADGEIEYFLPSRKLQVKKANTDLVLNPLAKNKLHNNQSTPVNVKKMSFSTTNTPSTPGSSKRVKIALKHNTSQNPAEYIQQIKSSPNIPYDAKKKPGKGLLKPNAMPSPINPFYKKKIGLKLLNDTI
ncbi:ribosomal RNA processing protein 1 homolog Nnp-1 [Haematobia irritans]|uniref:ribosomal RNA processing protein 1 homolog Nnp-1 n=1 Tax=Haematobia irritans TaxID=7368 RepID=UPI003F4F5033